MTRAKYPDIINSFDGAHQFLSNFYPVQLFFRGEMFPSVEHAYQAWKARVSGDEERFKRIQSAETAGKAKRLAYFIKIKDSWHMQKVPLMRELVGIKFKELELARMLEDTGDRELVEGNYWGDTFWGVCRGEGENHLGKILMEVRHHNRTVRFADVFKEG